MPIRHEFPKYEDRRRSLRREATLPEALLWRHLRSNTVEGFKFRRQHQLGNYIADFYCSAASLVLEVDGGQHLEPDSIAYDNARTRYFESRGLRVVRFTNLEVLNEMEGVMARILEALEAPSP